MYGDSDDNVSNDDSHEPVLNKKPTPSGESDYDNRDLVHRLEKMEKSMKRAQTLSGNCSNKKTKKAKIDSSSIPPTGRGMKKIFTLLPEKGSMKKPTSNGVKILEVNGLWEKDVKISSQDSRMEIVAKLKKVFPQLTDLRGGVRWLKAIGHGSILEPITIFGKTVGGMSATEMKEHAGSGIIYLSPLQESIPLSSIETVPCIYCAEEYPIEDIHGHVDHCPARSSIAQWSVREEPAEFSPFTSRETTRKSVRPSKRFVREESVEPSPGTSSETAKTNMRPSKLKALTSASFKMCALGSAPLSPVKPDSGLNIGGMRSREKPRPTPSKKSALGSVPLSPVQSGSAFNISCFRSRGKPRPTPSKKSALMTPLRLSPAYKSTVQAQPTSNREPSIQAAKETMREYKLNTMISSEEEARNHFLGAGNVIRVKRENLLKQADRISKNEEFLRNIRSPLIVYFVGEDNQDGIESRNEFISTLIGQFVLVLKSVMSGGEYDMRRIIRLQFASGIFFAIAIVQCGIYHPFMLTYYERAREEGGLNSDQHPYIDAFNRLGVANLLDFHPEVRMLFSDTIITGAAIFSLLKFPTVLTVKQRETIFFFIKFINDSQEGSLYDKVDCLSVFKWLTGSQVVRMPLNSNEDITVSFQEVNEIETTLSSPVANPSGRSLRLPLTKSYDEMRDACRQAVSVVVDASLDALISNFPLI